MNKRIIIIVIVLGLLGGLAWYFFGRSSSVPLSETLNNVLPFGTGGDSTGGTTNTGSNGFGTGTSTGAAPAHLFKISDAAVAGATAFVTKAGALEVRYVERATGHIFEVDPVSLAKSEIVNTTIPKVYEALWRPDGSAVIYRTLRSDGETIDTVSYALTAPSGTSTADTYAAKSNALPANVAEISAGQKDIFYNVLRQPQIVSALFDGTKAATIFSTDFTQWRLAAAGDTAVVMTAKATAAADGYAYKLDTKGTLSKLLGPLPALITTPNQTLTRIAYSYATDSGTVLAAKNLVKGSTYVIRPATLAEKCTWSAKESSVIYCAAPIESLGAGEPDLWYQGVSHYTDRIWKFDTDNDIANLLIDPKKSFNQTIDAKNLFLSPNEDYLFFTDRNTLILWALKLD